MPTLDPDGDSEPHYRAACKNSYYYCYYLLSISRHWPDQAEQQKQTDKHKTGQKAGNVDNIALWKPVNPFMP